MEQPPTAEAWQSLPWPSPPRDSIRAVPFTVELQELRAAIRQDLREELGRAFAGPSRPGTSGMGGGSPHSATFLTTRPGSRGAESDADRAPRPKTPTVIGGDLDAARSSNNDPLRSSASSDQAEGPPLPNICVYSEQGTQATYPGSEISARRSELSEVSIVSLQGTPGSTHLDATGSPKTRNPSIRSSYFADSVLAAVNSSPKARASRASHASGSRPVKFSDARTSMGKTTSDAMRQEATMRSALMDARRSMRNLLGKFSKSADKNSVTAQDSLGSSAPEEEEGGGEGFSWKDVVELVTAIAIVLNGICFGVQTEILCHNRTEEPPMFFFFTEIIFCVIFTTELIVRFSTQRMQICNPEHRYWNCFDTFLVLLQLFDLMMEALKSVMGEADIQLSFLRMLRILRILRVMRLVRLLKFFGELNVVTGAIANSLKSLVGTVMMLFLVIYIFALAFTGVANSHLIMLIEEGAPIEDNPTAIWWSSVGRAILSLYEAIHGGVDWDDLIQGLLEINIFWALLLVVYVAFMMLTMLNVITGIFVDSAVKHAAADKEKTFASSIGWLFRSTDIDKNGMISRDEFELEMERPEFHYCMEQVGVEPREARVLFDLLDLDHSGGIDLEEFLAGMLRLRAGSKFIDIMNLHHEIEQLRIQLIQSGGITVKRTHFLADPA